VTTATVLCADIVGSSEAPDVERLLRSAATASGAVSLQDRDGGLMAVFESVTAGLGAALVAERELAGEERWASGPVAVRAALSVGDVTWDEEGVRGRPLAEAARLAGMAENGQVLCTDQVRGLAAFGDPDLPFGYLDEPRVHEFRWRDLHPAGDDPLPPWLDERHPPGVVGRETELAELRAELSAAEAGTRTVLVTGERGEGKTDLLSAVAREAARRGFTVLAGRCHDPAREAYEPIAGAVRRLAGTSAVRLLRAGVAEAEECRQLVRLAPALSGPPLGMTVPPDDDPVSDRYRLVRATRTLIERLARVRPVLLVVDDLHRASAGSLEILRSLRWDESPPRLLVLVTARPGQGVRPRGLDRRVALRPRRFDRAQIAAILAAAPDVELAAPEAAAARLHHQTGGDALLVTEVVRELMAGRDLDEVPVADSAARMVADRLDRLSPRARAVADLLAVGERMRHETLRAGLGFDGVQFAGAVAEMTAAGLLTQTARWYLRFSHEPTREAVYAALPESRAAELHGRVADLLLEHEARTLGTRPYVLAGHLLRAARASAGIGRVRQAIGAVGRAAEEALARLAHAEAVTWYEGLLDLLDLDPGTSAERRAETLAACGRAMWLAGDSRSWRTLQSAVEPARRSGRDDLIVAVASTGDRGFFSTTAAIDPDRIALLEEALRLVDPADLRTRALLTAQLAAELTWAYPGGGTTPRTPRQGRPGRNPPLREGSAPGSAPDDGERRFTLSDVALGWARAAGDPRILVRVLGLRNLTVVPEGTPERRRAETEEMLAAARATGDDLALFHATFQGISGILDTGDTEEVTRWLDRAGELAGRLAQPHLFWLVSFSRAALLLMRGRIDEAESEAERSLRLGLEIGREYEAPAFFAEQTGEIRRLRGRLGEVRDAVRRAVEDRMPDPAHVLLRFLTELDDEAAGPVLRRIVGEHGVIPPRNMAQRPALDNLALAASRQGADDLLDPLYKALEPHGDTFGHSAVAHHCGHHYLAHLAAASGDPALAAEHFEAAAAVHERCSVPLLMAESLLDWADLDARTPGTALAPPGLRERAAGLLTGRGAALLERRLSGTGR